MYHFKKLSEDIEQQPSSYLCSIYKDQRDSWKVFGQMKTLFGEPLYITRNLENQFEYIIEATDEDGTSLILYVYSGSSGPAIGGGHSERQKEAAAQLVSYIVHAEVSDYEYEGYYMDAPCKVIEKVQSGIHFYEEIPLELSEEEFMQLCDEIL